MAARHHNYDSAVRAPLEGKVFIPDIKVLS